MYSKSVVKKVLLVTFLVVLYILSLVSVYLLTKRYVYEEIHNDGFKSGLSSCKYIEQAEKNASQDKEEKIKSCIEESQRNYSLRWDELCKKSNLESDCMLPNTTANILDTSRKEKREDCYKIYSCVYENENK